MLGAIAALGFGLVPRTPAIPAGTRNDGCVRVWNFAGTGTSALSVGLGGGADRDQGGPLMVARGTLPGEQRNYRRVPPGRYLVAVSPAEPAAGGSGETLPHEELALAPGEHRTILLLTRHGRPAIEILADDLPEDAPPRLRVLNLTEVRPALAEVRGGERRVISPAIPPGISELSRYGAGGNAIYEVGIPRGDGSIGKLRIEVGPGAARSRTLTIAHDRYGRIEVWAAVDAELGGGEGD